MKKRIVGMRGFMIQKLLMLALFVTLSWNAPAHAQGTPEARLKEIAQTILNDQVARFAGNTSRPATLKMDGPIGVEPAGDYYAITMPQLSLQYADGQKLNIGMLSINASAADKPGEWKMTVALPTPMVGVDAAGKENLRIVLGDQKVAGIWNESIKGFTKLDAAYKNIRLDFPANAGFVDIAQALVRYDFTSNAQNLWSGPAYFEAANASWKLPTLYAEGNTGKISLNAKIDQFSTALAGVNNGLIFSPAMLTKPGLYKAVNGMDLKIFAENAHIAQNNPKAGKAFDYNLGAGETSLIMKKTNTGSMDANLSLNFAGLKNNKAVDELADVIPSQGDITLTNKNVPAGALADIFVATPQAALSMPMMILKIPALLSQSGTFIQTENSYISGDKYRIDMDALLRADITALNSATGEGHVEFKGLDNVLASLQIIGTKNPHTPYGLFCRNAAAFLERVKTLGKVKNAPDNDFIHTFDVVMGKDGAILINGQNAMTAGKSSPAAVPPPAVQKTP